MWLSHRGRVKDNMLFRGKQRRCLLSFISDVSEEYIHVLTLDIACSSWDKEVYISKLRGLKTVSIQIYCAPDPDIKLHSFF